MGALRTKLSLRNSSGAKVAAVSLFGLSVGLLFFWSVQRGWFSSATWKPQSSGTQRFLYSVAFVSPQAGWAVGSHGTILHTVDGGQSWQAQSSGTQQWLRSVAFISPQAGWVVGDDGTILHTADRGKGDENSSEHMRQFAKSVFRLMRDGAASVLLLHHSAKGTKESNELTLENSMCGSGELGAFLSSCWATRLQDPTEPYQSASYVRDNEVHRDGGA